MDGPILIKLYTVVEYDLSEGVHVENPDPTNIKGDNSKGDNYLYGTVVSFVIWLAVLV